MVMTEAQLDALENWIATILTLHTESNIRKGSCLVEDGYDSYGYIVGRVEYITDAIYTEEAREARANFAQSFTVTTE